MLNYNIAAENGSMYNTPPCWPIYICGLVFKHLLKLGGLAGETTTHRADDNSDSAVHLHLSSLRNCGPYATTRALASMLVASCGSLSAWAMAAAPEHQWQSALQCQQRCVPAGLSGLEGSQPCTVMSPEAISVVQ